MLAHTKQAVLPSSATSSSDQLKAQNCANAGNQMACYETVINSKTAVASAGADISASCCMKRWSALPIDAAGHRMEMYVPTTQHHTTAQQPETQNTPASTYVLLPFFVFFLSLCLNMQSCHKLHKPHCCSCTAAIIARRMQRQQQVWKGVVHTANTPPGNVHKCTACNEMQHASVACHIANEVTRQPHKSQPADSQLCKGSTM